MINVAKQHVTFSVCLWWENTWQIWANSLFFSPMFLNLTKAYYSASKGSRMLL